MFERFKFQETNSVTNLINSILKQWFTQKQCHRFDSTNRNDNNSRKSTKQLCIFIKVLFTLLNFPKYKHWVCLLYISNKALLESAAQHGKLLFLNELKQNSNLQTYIHVLFYYITEPWKHKKNIYSHNYNLCLGENLAFKVLLFISWNLVYVERCCEPSLILSKMYRIVNK